MSEEITIIRTQHGKMNPYFMMNRCAAQNRELSWEARGVLTYLLSKPDDWEVQVADLQQGCGRDKVYRIIAELEKYGHIKKEQAHTTAGKFDALVYRVYETPLTDFQETVQGESPLPCLPYTAKPTLHNIESTEDQKKEKQNTEKDSVPPAQSPEKKDESETQNPQPDSSSELDEKTNAPLQPTLTIVKELPATVPELPLTPSSGQPPSPTPVVLPKPRSAAQQELDDLKKCIAYAWKQDLAKSRWLTDLLANFLTGKVSKSRQGTEWDKHKLEEPLTGLEIIAFAQDWGREHPGMDMPQKPEAVEMQCMTFKGSVRYAQAVKQAQVKYDELVHGIKHVFVPVPRPDMVVSPEAAAKADHVPTPEEVKAVITTLATAWTAKGARR